MEGHASNRPSPKEDVAEEEPKVYGSIIGRNLYNSGRPLWTREQFRDFGAQLDANPEWLVHTRLNGKKVHFKNQAFGEDARHWRTKVIFFGWRYLLHPTTHPGLNFQFCTLGIEQVDTRIKRFGYLLPQHDPNELHRLFHLEKTHWARCEARQNIEKLLSNYELPPTINKLVCFGLGNDLIGKYDFGPQHPAALTLREYLVNRLGHPVRLLTQDPEYTSDTTTVLTREGFEVVGMNGMDGFLEVDENSVVLSIFVDTHVKEILADFTRPAVIIDIPFEPQDLDWDKIDWPNIKENPASTYDVTNPDTPRTEAMFKEYHDAGRWTPRRWGSPGKWVPLWSTELEVWVRKNGSRVLNTETPDETRAESSKEKN
ncbi:hypothetical protein F5Y12DRAFT_798523 [Xylaria sp. FL1777]|nr:hypothetical protein F5Y12DRAFT_798523 [Xylaria sp. FL1777]